MDGPMMTAADSRAFSDSDDSGSSVVPDPEPAPGDASPPKLSTDPLGGSGGGRRDGSGAPPSLNVPRFIPRAYQLEMFEESLKRNIIVAQDTGSGKTHIAILRILHELDHASPEKIIWFIAPTLSLCIQQHSLLKEQISAVQIRFLSGNDGVEKWKHQRLWDAILKNVRIVVSTPQILLDALNNGFVDMGTLSLLIFDEAHNCIKGHPGSKIMKDFYQVRKAQGPPVPHILGLSASPIMNSKVESLARIEETLNSICKTPIKKQAELLQYVNMPKLRQVFYTEGNVELELKRSTGPIASLYAALSKYNINDDPYIRRLRLENTEKSKRALEQALRKMDTWCFRQMKAFCRTSLVICRELGTWAADYYIAQVVAKFGRLIDTNSDYLETWSNGEKRHLYQILRKVEITPMTSEAPLPSAGVSDKVKQFITALLHDGVSTGIVFVEQRATVAVLAHLLSVHPLTSKLRVGAMVGMSENRLNKTSICGLINLEDQRHILTIFRAKELDLVIATSVLEEGIDVPACNMVMCFDLPANLKSFVQRRGRARKSDSQLILMQAFQSNKIELWQDLEAEMKRIYADDMRSLKELNKVEDLEEHDGYEFRIERTGALLNLDNAVAHLYHFCAVLPEKQYADRRPEFVLTENEPMRVLLPLCVDKAVRVAFARRIWSSEKNAKKDAAFQAYKSLYDHKLVDDNLMPLLRHDAVLEGITPGVKETASLVDVSALIDPWFAVATALNNQVKEQLVWKSAVTVKDTNNKVLSTGEMMLPTAVPGIRLLRLYWDADTEVRVTVEPSVLDSQVGSEALLRAQEHTRAILTAAFGWRFAFKDEAFLAPLMFSEDHATIFDPKRYEKATDRSLPLEKEPSLGLVRDTTQGNKPYIFREYLNHKPPAYLTRHSSREYEELPTNAPYVAVSILPRRTDFLHKVPATNKQPSRKRYSVVLPITNCVFDRLPFSIVQFAMFIPTIMHRLGVYIVADILCKTILEDVRFEDHSLVVTAISASSASEETNYQRLEFLGDSILKFCTSLQLLGDNPLWHEGYLSSRKDQIVANSRLAAAALHIGLDRFILTKSFTGRKWRPAYLKEVLSSNSLQTETRKISMKVLADVVEALIGAAVMDGGMPKALACMRVFLPELNWESLEYKREQIFDVVQEGVKLPPPLVPLEELIGYTFSKKRLLIEAMTHASCNTDTGSYERFEFLGDAVLDNIVVATIYSQVPELSHVQMHRLRTALVNAHFLAFLCIEWAVTQEAGDILKDSATGTFQTTGWSIRLPLWKFMRHASQLLSSAQQEASARHSVLRDDILAAIESGSHYPWALFARLQAPKFFSDIVESLLGAVYIDSGSFKACEGILERIGIMSYLRRIVADGVHIVHPTEELGWLADMEKVYYKIRVEERIVDTVQTREYTCEVFVGDKSVVAVGGGVDSEEIKAKAAEAAVKILKEQSSGEGRGLDVEKVMLEGMRGGDGGAADENSKVQCALEDAMDLT